VNAQTGKRERTCTYKVTVTAVFGSTTVSSTEPQIIGCELSNSHYIVDTEVRNEGIKYADAFYVASRYCLIQTGRNKSHLKLTCEVKYVKSLMAIIKSFIEKNAMAALQDSFTDLMKRLDEESSKQSRTMNNNDEEEGSIQTQAVTTNQRSSRRVQSEELSSSINDRSSNLQECIDERTNSDLIVPQQKSSSTNTFFIIFCIITMVFLLIVNIFLCMKLTQIDRTTDLLVRNHPTWFNRYSSPKDDSGWSSLLKKQEEYYQAQLNNLQTILVTTHNALKNVTNALNQLSDGTN